VISRSLVASVRRRNSEARDCISAAGMPAA